MAFEKKETTLVDLFEKHAATKQEAARVRMLVSDYDILHMTFGELLSIKGMGRKGALLVMHVACDLKGKN